MKTKSQVLCLGEKKRKKLFLFERENTYRREKENEKENPFPIREKETIESLEKKDKSFE